ncbi:olfactory receptor 5V1-like [Discoglossus pictus]
MDRKNETYFIIKGISEIPKLQTPIFLLVVLIYLFSVGGNMTIFLLICLDPKLHTPMYFFLANLSVIDTSFTTVALHNVFLSFISGDKKMSLLGCMAQVYIVFSLTGNEVLLLAAMSYDRYVAICNPLRYSMVMNHRMCVLLATLCWVLGFIDMAPQLSALSRFSCFTSNIINHFFCDIVALIKLSCSDTSLLELLILTEGSLLGGFTPFVLTFIPYIFIILSIMKIRSNTGRRKAFYTCSSHLTVVTLLYVTLACQYLRPISMDTLNSNKLLSLFNTAAVPMVNPLIYSLKNKDVKSALKRMLRSLKIRFLKTYW